MPILKENHMKYNVNGSISIKTDKNNIELWSSKIKSHMGAFNFSIDVLDINSDVGFQHVYTKDDIKFNFEFYSNGRITIKTKNMEQLKTVFIDQHEAVLGVALTEMKNNPCRKSTTFQPLNSSTPIPSSSREINLATEETSR